MKRIVAAVALAVILAAVFTTTCVAGSPFIDGEIIVKFKPGTPGSAKSELHRRNGSQVLQVADVMELVRVTAPKGKEQAHAGKYASCSWVEYAEPNYVASIVEVIPSDPYFESNQWDMARIQSPAVWGLTVGSNGLTVAVLDTGVDYNHPDLIARIVPGYDFCNGDSDPMDDHGHGTCVAGIIGADTDNGMGVAGITWYADIMPIKVANASGSATYYDIAQGIMYATDNGACVASISIAGAYSSSTLANAVDYAFQRGCLVVAASGNNSTSTVYFPAGCTNALAVGASDQNDNRTSYSNYGPALDVLAPGYGYTTTRGGGYGGFGGTSAATPHVAGVAALVLSENLGLSAASVASLITGSADDLGTFGWDEYTGWGRVNAYNAVVAAGSVQVDADPPVVSITSPAAGAEVSGTVTLTTSAADNVGVNAVDFFVDGAYLGTASGAFSLSWDSKGAQNGSHTLTARAYDLAGNAATSAPVALNVHNSVTTTQTFSGSLSPKSGTRVHAWQTGTAAAVKVAASWSGAALQLRVYDSSRMLIASMLSASSPVTMDLGTLPAGTYTFEVSAPSGKIRYQLTVTAASQ